MKWRALVLAVVAAPVAGVWALGGFEAAPRVVDDPVGRTIDLGPAEVSVEKVTAQRDYEGRWKMAVVSTCRVTDDRAPSLNRSVDEYFAVMSDRGTRFEGKDPFLRVAPGKEFGLERNSIGPGLAPMPCVWTATMPKGYDPSQGAKVVLVEMAWGDDSVVGNQEEHWHADAPAHRIVTEVEVLPDE